MRRGNCRCSKSNVMWPIVSARFLGADEQRRRRRRRRRDACSVIDARCIENRKSTASQSVSQSTKNNDEILRVLNRISMVTLKCLCVCCVNVCVRPLFSPNHTGGLRFNFVLLSFRTYFRIKSCTWVSRSSRRHRNHFMHMYKMCLVWAMCYRDQTKIKVERTGESINKRNIVH